MKIFAINPGSTSTKIALFDNDKIIFSENVSHDAKVLAQFKNVSDQLIYRKTTIMKILDKNNISIDKIDAFVGRGGGLCPIIGGTYEINDILLDHARRGANGIQHPAQLGSQLAHELAQEFGGRSFVVNPPDVDEFQDIARITGIDGLYRSSHIHSLNQKEIAIRHAKSMCKNYEDCNFVVCHIGGGISITAHKKGMMIDSNDIVEGKSPMAPTRMGAIPGAKLIRLCYSGKYTEAEMLEKCTKTGGFIDHLGTSDALEVSNRAEQGDKKAALIWQAMIYQIIKEIGSMAAVLHGEVDGILLGGGMVHNKNLVMQIEESCSFIAPVSAYPGEFEMEALASGALRVLMGREEPKEYSGEPIWSEFEFMEEVSTMV